VVFARICLGIRKGRDLWSFEDFWCIWGVGKSGFWCLKGMRYELNLFHRMGLKCWRVSNKKSTWFIKMKNSNKRGGHGNFCLVRKNIIYSGGPK
jgi:hypothetical protein